MKLFWKLFCCMVLVSVLGLAAGGFLLIDGQFQTSLQQEVEALNQENDFLYYALTVQLESSALTDREQLQDVLADMSVVSSGQTVNFRLSDAAGIIIAGSRLPVKAVPLTGQLGAAQRGWDLQDVAGVPYLHAASPLTLLGETVYLENFRSVGSLFVAREEQYQSFSWVMLILAVAAAVLSGIISALILRPLKRLSDTAGQFAAGQLEQRVRITGDDEITALSKDFNTMADQLERQVEELKAEAQRREDFIGSFTHELKTPLTSIIGYAELLRSRPDDIEQVLDSAGYIFREGRRLESLSRKLLDLIVLNQEKVERKKVPMEEYLEQVGGALRPALEAQNLHLIISAKPGTAEIEPDLIEALCLNLLDNARKASSPGGAIRLEGFPEEQGYCIQVEDQGRGIPPEDLARVTEAFYMVDKSRARAQGGAGLGLALCQRIAELHGGTLEITSELGKGTTVRVLLKGVVET